MKIDQMHIIPHSLKPFRESQFWSRAKLGSQILLSAESWKELSEAFVIFIVILLTYFPTQHRYTDMVQDLRREQRFLTKQYQLQEFTGGRLSNDLVLETFSNLF